MLCSELHCQQVWIYFPLCKGSAFAHDVARSANQDPFDVDGATALGGGGNRHGVEAMQV